MRWLAIMAMSACAASEPPPQPLPFSHAVHAGAQAIACTDCHPGAMRGARAGLPPLGRCLSCHMRPQGDPPSEREQRVRLLAVPGASSRPNRWVQLTRNPGHVYFSHRAHTAIAGMDCAQCHGDVRAWSAPPTAPNRELMDMDLCMSCHRKRGASNQCKTCHK